VAPEARFSEEFSWTEIQGNLLRVRLELQANTADVGSLLRSAFTDAYRVADYCYDTLSGMKPGETAPREAFEDWRKFFKTFEKDIWDVYINHSTVKVNETKDLLSAIAGISGAAKDAHWELLDWRESNNTAPSGRRPAVEQLQKLILALKAILKELQPSPKAADIHHVEEIRKATRLEAHPGTDPKDPIEDPAYAADASTAAEPDDSVPVRVGWRIAAGEPSIADQSIEEVFPLPNRLMEEGELVWVKVADQTLKNSSIANGDWIVVGRHLTAEDGDIVAVDIDGETTVRTFSQAGQETILGKVVAVLRRVR
jgi:SOS-response transcriptional repressor LexA